METLNCFKQSLAITEKKGETLKWISKKEQNSEMHLLCLSPALLSPMTCATRGEQTQLRHFAAVGCAFLRQY